MVSENFSHRQLPTGGLQSVCMHCFFTVGFGRDEAELEKVESRHHCQQRRTAEADTSPAAQELTLPKRRTF